jgi:hypothetical protein
MSRFMTCFASMVLVTVVCGAHDNARAQSPAREQYQALLKEYDEAGRSRALVAKFLAIAEDNPKDPVAVDALAWVVTNVPSGSQLSRALDMLSQDHLESDKLGDVCAALVRKPSAAAEQLLRSLAEKSPHRSVRGLAHFHLAGYFEHLLTLKDSLEKDPNLARRFDQSYGKGFSKSVASLDRVKVTKQIETLYERVASTFADVPTSRGTLGPAAETELFAIRHLSVGGTAPEIEGDDVDGKPLRLSDYRGKVVVLDFWGHW